MKIRFLICIACVLFSILSISACSSPDPLDPEEPPVSSTVNQAGTLVFPMGSSINPPTLTVIGTSGTSTPSASGAYTVEVLKGYYSFVYVNSQSDKTVAAAYVKSGDTPTINEISTALALTMMFPVPWGEAGLTPENLIREIQSSPDFQQLVSYVGNVMVNDPEGLMDYSAHPAIMETACKIVISVAQQHGLLNMVQEKQAKAGNTASLLTVEDVLGSPNLHVTNWLVTPYGMSSYDMSKDARQITSYNLTNKLPFYVNPLGLNWWIVPTPGKADYPLGDGNFVFMLSKTDPWALTAFGPISYLSDYVNASKGLSEGDYIKVLQADAGSKAAMGSMVFLTARALGIVNVVDPTSASGFAKLALDEGPAALELISGITFADEDWVDLGTQQYKTKGVKWLLRIVKNNASKITGWALKASKGSVKIGTRALKTAASNLSIIMDVIDAVGDAALLFLYALDTFSAERDLVFYITQANGNAAIVASVPPDAPSITGPTSGTSGTVYSFSVRSVDPDGDDIRYSVHFGDGTSGVSSFVTSGTSNVFSHSFLPGNYTVYCSCVDSKGATSALSSPHQISIYPVGGFGESFESYQLGGFASTGAWTIDYLEPSRVLISEIGMQSSRSIKFVDYDPSIGEAEGYYAMARADTVGNPTTVEFYVRVDNVEDAFGIRTWGSYGTWSTMGYYVLVDRGWFKWVKKAAGGGIDDPTDFIPIKQIEPFIWYKISLIINWPAQSYSISINDELLTPDATFVAQSRGYSLASAPTMQLVAFTDAQCRSAYVDNVSLAGATLGMIRINEAPSNQSALRIGN